MTKRAYDQKLSMERMKKEIEDAREVATPVQPDKSGKAEEEDEECQATDETD